MHLAMMVSTYLRFKGEIRWHKQLYEALTGYECRRCRREWQHPEHIARNLRMSQGGSTPEHPFRSQTDQGRRVAHLACNQSCLLAHLCRVEIVLRHHLMRDVHKCRKRWFNTSIVWIESEISAQNSSTIKSSFLSANCVSCAFSCSS